MVSVEKLSKSYNGKKVLDNVNFDIENNEFLVILGPSGSGKSTLLRLISGIEQMDEGTVSIDNIAKNKQELIDCTATIFQSFALFLNMNVYNNIAFSIRKENKKDKDLKVRKIAELLKIDHLLDRKVTKLSGGEQQRVSIARALIRDVNMYLFDEPLSSLDEHLKKVLIKEIKQIHQDKNKLFIYVTHNQEEAKLLGTKVLILNDGKVEGFGRYEDLYNNPKTLFTAEFLGTINKIPAKIICKNKLHYLEIYNKLYLLDKNKYDTNQLKEYINKEIVVGIRPEYIKITSDGIKVQIEDKIESNFYNKYYVKNECLKLIVDSNIKTTKKTININIENNIMLFDKKTLKRI